MSRGTRATGREHRARRLGSRGRSLGGVAFLVVLLAARPPQEAPQRWAVLVGISDYIHFEDVEGGDLPGAEGDARAMRDVLVSRWGFPEQNVLLLLNREATRQAIEKALTEWLPERVRDEDQVVFFFAGHGSQVWDESGDEEDGLDETIAPADVDPVDPAFDIVDEVLGGWLRALSTDDVWYVHDNCSAANGARVAPPLARIRALGRRVDALSTLPAEPARRSLAANPDLSGHDVVDGEIMELAASQPNQVAVDVLFSPGEGVEPFSGGAFTTFLVQELWRAPEGTTYEEVFLRVSDALERNRFEQDPWLTEANPRRREPILGGRAFAEGGAGPRTGVGVPVLAPPRRGTTGAMEVELGAGAATGLVPGSELRTAGGARLTVTALTRDRAVARVAPGTVEVGERAVLVAQPLQRARLTVATGRVGAGTVDGLAAELEGTGIRLQSDSAGYAHLFLRRRGSEVLVLAQDGSTRHTVEAGREGIAALAAVLRREAAALTLGQLHNPAPSFGVRIELADGERELAVGENITFSLTSERSGFLTLVEMGPDGTVTVLLPNPHGGESRIRAGRTSTFPTAAMGFQIVARPPGGRGLVRAFVTEEPLAIPVGVDFRTGFDGLAREIHTALLRAAGTTAQGAVLLGSWSTAALVYEVRP